MRQKSQLGSWRERETFWVCPNKQKGVRNKQQTMRQKKANQTHGESVKPFRFCSNEQMDVRNKQQTMGQNKANQTHDESIKPFISMHVCKKKRPLYVSSTEKDVPK